MSSIKQLLASMCKIGCIGFGGGSALIPVMEEELIKGRGAEEKKQYDLDVVVASITPGALPVELAASVGKRQHGTKGMILAALAFGAPGAILTLLLISVLTRLSGVVLSYVQVASLGVSAFIMYLLTNYIYQVILKCREENEKRLFRAIVIMLLVMVLAFGKNIYYLLGIDAVPIFSVSTFHILLAAFFFILYTKGQFCVSNLLISAVLAGIYLLGHGKAQVIHQPVVLLLTELLMLVLAVNGVRSNIKTSKKKRKKIDASMFRTFFIWFFLAVLSAVPILFLVFGAALSYVKNGALSVLMSFGGGDAYLTVAQGLFVDTGLLSEHQFLSDVITVVNILPGSILCKTLVAIGYEVGINVTGAAGVGLLFALSGFMISICVSCGFYFLVYDLYDTLKSLHVFRLISRWIRPMIAGLLINIMLSLFSHAAKNADITGIGKTTSLLFVFLLYVMNLLLKKCFHLKHTWLLALDVAIIMILYQLTKIFGI
ncbi:MAG: chromate transporter [Lachnospiraceae bacterium]|nr:chromate transporter [Lachnospiraceae bacterium]